jgi:hypothetical protein
MKSEEKAEELKAEIYPNEINSQKWLNSWSTKTVF